MYRQTGEDVLSMEVLRNRWKLFGHVLQSHPETPAQKAMNYYFGLIIIDETKRNETKFCEILRNTAKYEKITTKNPQNSQTISQIFTSVDPVRKTVKP